MYEYSQCVHFLHQEVTNSTRKICVIQHNIPANLPLPAAYLNSLNDDYKTIALRACILVFIATTNALAHGLDCTVDSGTGSGKTLCQIILNLLYPNSSKCYSTACINEDTPSDRNLWEPISTIHGLPPFRPAWGKLIEFRLRLPKGVPFQLNSGMLPPHIKKALHDHLNFDPQRALSSKLSSNQPNIDFRNADVLTSIPYKPLVKCLVFVRATFRTRDVLRVFDDFSDPNGVCKILNATEGASTGLDVPNIEAVIEYGLPQKKSTSQERGGRAGRRGQFAVYLSMAEPWAYTASLDTVLADCMDPDRPLCGRLAKMTPKPARAGLAMILYVRSSICLCKMISDYLADQSPEALSISFEWCCEKVHPGRPELQFDKRKFFQGRFIYQEADRSIYAGASDEKDCVHLNPPVSRKRGLRSTSNRKVDQRAPLQALIRSWLTKAHSTDELRDVRPASFILDAKSIKTLSTVEVSTSVGDTKEGQSELRAVDRKTHHRRKALY
ncbi:P-loop containing nucleoside triphosphate hydrolase protein [Favolaschia claudopus]|uniref:P-loop containing nucleoside triphosphate hydrolase protein n=1 Tax=Favolaschia claudopus TaxID=2862362 RepID=A0AAV9ZXK1_9AGAR